MEYQQNLETTNRGQRLIDWINERYHMRELMAAMLHVHIPKASKTYYLGGITLFLFLVQVVTGSLLALYYRGTPDEAYDSVMFITSTVQFGWLIRSIHAWGANLMVAFCILHLLRIFFQAAYKAPRELTWGVGVVLLLVTMGFGFTGYLLPWDQRAYWATTVGSEMAGAFPIGGEFLLRFLRGGENIAAATLSRFYGIHTLILPMTIAALIGVHLLLIHQQGLADPHQLATAKPVKTPSDKGKPFFPNYVLGEVVSWYMIIGLLIILASLFPAGLEDKANPLETPPHIKPEWYFLSLYQILKFVPRVMGVLLPAVAIIMLFLLPFIDRSPEVSPRKRPAMVTFGIITVIVIVVFTVWGKVS